MSIDVEKPKTTYTLDIDTLIANEDDAKQRTFLIVLNNLNTSLIANTSTIAGISEKLEGHLKAFDLHAKNEEKLMNQGKGMWRIIAATLFVIQFLGVGIWNLVREDITQLRADTLISQKTDVRLEGQIARIEGQIARLESRK